MENGDFDKHFGRIHARHSGALNRYMIECRKARETVRRKLELLIARGWIARGEHGYVTATDMANHALQSLTQSTLRYLADLKAVFEQIA